MTLSRRAWLRVSGTTAVGSLFAASMETDASAASAETDPPHELPPPIAALKPVTEGPPPIGLEERRARLARAQGIMGELGLDAVVLASGTSLEYFTGVHWALSERFFGMILTRQGEPGWVTPAFERKRAEEQIQIGSDVRAWEEHASPYSVVASMLADRKASARIGIEETMPFVFADGIGQAIPGARIESATPATAGCRMIKDAHEIALMRRACEITLAAHRAVFASLKPGMTQEEVSALSADAHKKLGMRGGSLVLFGSDAAFPHGTTKPKPLKVGDVVLIDGGGRLHGYASDITRTGVFGAPPTERQRRVWDVVKGAQEAAFKAARPGVECQSVDAAARKCIDEAGFGPGYRCFTHRLGHGIGMDGHEWTYLVRGNATRLQPGMCFSNEPGVYIHDDMGIRHEDVMWITETGSESMVRLSGSPEEPAVL